MFDFIIVGAGTNGLVAAAYLCKAGLSTLVLERSDMIGGGAVTRELTLPGFKHDVFATSLNTWKGGSIQKELELEKYGFKEALPDPVTAHPFGNGRAIIMYRDLKKTLNSIAQFSANDAKKFAELYNYYRNNREILLGAVYAPPPPYSLIMPELEKSDEGLEFLRLSFMSTRDYIDETFESVEVKAWLAVWGSNHVPFAPEDQGSTLFLIVFMGILQEHGCGVPIGGISTLCNSIRRYIDAHGGAVRMNSDVAQITVRGQVAKGVQLKSGEMIEAKIGVVSDVEPKQLFLKLVGEDKLDSLFIKKVKRYKYSKVSQVMIHAALDEWLDYSPPDVRKAGIVQIAPSIESVSHAFNQIVNGELPEEPFMTIDNTSGYDRTRAPAGKHTLWDFVRAPAQLRNRSWDSEKDRFADHCLDYLSRYAPNIKQSVLKKVVLSPVDIERMNPNMVNGDPGLGKPCLDQSLTLRPFAGWSQYRTPIKGLYTCGAFNHPGGGVSGAPAYNAVSVILQDLGKI